MMESKVEAAIGMSRKWDAREAGREVAETAIQKLKEPPSFFLLFSTIHYEKYGGFQEFLNGVWDVLPRGTPLIGGTVTGFINNYGCYVRGASALAVSSSTMDVAIGCGTNTKRNPKKAARESSQMIRKQLTLSTNKNKFLLNVISGPEMPNILGLGQKKLIRSGLISRIGSTAFGFSQTIFQKGLGREDEIFEEVVQNFPEFHQVLGTTMDDYRGIHNYQFFDQNVMTNAIVILALEENLNLDVCTTHGMKKTDISFEITRLGIGNHAIQEINHKQAVPEFLRLLKWPEEFLTEETMMHTILYYPISLKRKGREVPVVMPMILRNSIIVPCVIDPGKVSVMTVSGKKLIEALNENIEVFNTVVPEFGLGSLCITILQTLGDKTNMIKEHLDAYFKEKPFLMFFGAGEGTYSPIKGTTYANMSFNTAVFGRSKNYSI